MSNRTFLNIITVCSLWHTVTLTLIILAMFLSLKSICTPLYIKVSAVIDVMSICDADIFGSLMP